MNTEKFIQTVKRMRHFQRTYFKTRSQMSLIQSKVFEKQVDNMIEEHDSEIQPPIPFAD